MTRTVVRVACLLLSILVLAACGHSRVVERADGSGRGDRTAGRTASRPAPSGAASYTVRRGDTLYGIAFRHGLDYRDVAAMNRIPAPYTIYPGQRLALRPASTAVASRPVPPRPAATTPASPAVAAPPSTTRPPTTAGTPASTPMIPPPLPSTPRPAPSTPGAAGPTGWRWPTQGTVIGRFAAGDPKRQGLDIAGTAGQPVFAAADGTVVYSGAGLVGYGELIIVKHSDEWLSAYAHNRRRLVVEGTAVKGGQAIAELGRSGTSRDMLHFEVRRNGKPVDPLTVLPPAN
jgi:lipoprotein NlpD